VPFGEPVRVLLVTDVRLHRELLADALAEHDGIELAGSAPSVVAATAAAMFEPSVVIVNTASAAACVIPVSLLHMRLALVASSPP
jgi:chemotaxis response regulator CheB